MGSRKAIYNVAVILLTGACVFIMMYFRDSGYAAGDGYIPEYDVFDDYEDSKYLGYIFDDYNKSVNLEYVDTVYKDPSEGDESISAVSLTALDMGNDMDSSRRLISERVIEERALLDKVLDDTERSVMGTYDIAQLYDRMEPEVRQRFMDIMRRLSQNDILQVKRLFDMGITREEAGAIMAGLRGKLSNDEYDWLSDVTKK